MKFKIGRDKLLECLATTVHNVGSARAPQPALSHVLVQASDKEITLSATDLEVSVRRTVKSGCGPNRSRNDSCTSALVDCSRAIALGYLLRRGLQKYRVDPKRPDSLYYQWLPARGVSASRTDRSAKDL